MSKCSILIVNVKQIQVTLEDIWLIEQALSAIPSDYYKQILCFILADIWSCDE